MRVYFVRHGQTDLNGKGVVQGHLDYPLSAAGRVQVGKLGQHLAGVAFDGVWSSDLKRAEQTARGVLHGREGPSIKLDSRLKARYQGSLQGKQWIPGMSYPDDVEPEADLRERHADASMMDRLANWLTELLEIHSPANTPSASPIGQAPHSSALQHPPSILVVTHEECLTALLALFTAPSSVRRTDTPRSPLDVHVPEELPVVGYFPNTGFAVLQVGWEEEEESLVPKGNLLSWGSTDHLV